MACFQSFPGGFIAGRAAASQSSPLDQDFGLAGQGPPLRFGRRFAAAAFKGSGSRIRA
jgi:hypothetical protein